jgi:hypothetical protein
MTMTANHRPRVPLSDDDLKAVFCQEPPYCPTMGHHRRRALVTLAVRSRAGVLRFRWWRNAVAAALIVSGALSFSVFALSSPSRPSAPIAAVPDAPATVPDAAAAITHDEPPTWIARRQQRDPYGVVDFATLVARRNGYRCEITVIWRSP